MAKLPTLDTFKLADSEKPSIGFRVVVSGGDGWLQNSLRSLYPQAEATPATLEDHLRWGKTPSPFVSLWTSWYRAVNWAKSRAKKGGLDIDIEAVWIKEQDVYDAYKAAMTTLPLGPATPLQYYVGEVVVVDRGGDADLSLLDQFHWVTERQWERVEFDFVGKKMSTSLPIGSLAFETTDAQQSIGDKEARRWEGRDFAALLMGESPRTTGSGLLKVSEAWELAHLLCREPCPAVPIPTLRPTRNDIASDELTARLEALGI